MSTNGNKRNREGKEDAKKMSSLSSSLQGIKIIMRTTLYNVNPAPPYIQLYNYDLIISFMLMVALLYSCRRSLDRSHSDMIVIVNLHCNLFNRRATKGIFRFSSHLRFSFFSFYRLQRKALQPNLKASIYF